MKKITALIMVLCLCLAGCTGSKVDNGDPSGSSSTPTSSQSSNGLHTSADDYSEVTGPAGQKYFSELKQIEQSKDDSVAAYVNGSPLYQKDVLRLKANYNYAINQSLDIMDSQKEKDEWLDKYGKTDRDFLDLAIESMVSDMEAEKAKIQVDEKEVREYQTQNIATLKTSKPELLEAYLEAYGLTEKEYLEECIKGTIKSSKRNLYHESLCPRKNYDNKEEWDKAVKQALKQVMEDYEIEIVD